MKLTITSRIKLFETISLMLVIVPAAFLRMSWLLAGISLGIVLQLFIFFWYRSIDQDTQFLRKKIGPIIVSLAIVAYIMLRRNVI